ncbi:DMT family transporter [Burkholderiaceae bacterium FT117]|uniref:DMT family transporter n=1 Tax=Zeimonas sediminis TaxID=2944268 RepID=UPI00234302FB|nr:DMT family transporter [Zeimonas sediminis]MCM5569534.1 DMT family transporter [Zeimonas sediminis]
MNSSPRLPGAAPSASRTTVSRDAGALPPQAVMLQVLLCAIWGLGQVAMKVGNEGISPVWQAALRSAGAALLLLGWIGWRRIPVWRSDGTLAPGILAGTLFGLEFALLYSGLLWTNASRAAVLLYTSPFFVALGAHWFVPGDRLNRRKLVGLAAAFAGVVIAFGERAGAPQPNALLGDLMCLGAAVLWAATTIVLKTTPLRSAPPEKNLLYQLGVSALVMAALSALLGEPGVFAPSALIWGLLVFQTVVVALASYLAWFWMVSRYRATTLHAFTFLTPLFGVFFGAALLGEPVGATLVAALALIAGGIVLVNRA